MPAPTAQPPAEALVLGVAVVNFHHQVGPQIEWAFPSSLSDDTELMNQVPFYALPDGSHQSHEGLCLFHLAAPPTRRSGTVYGLACNRQVDASQLTVRDASMTRATVQKAVVVLTSAPVFAPVKQKLAIITRVYLSQGDLTDRALLADFATSLEEGLRASLRQSAIDARVRAQTSLVGLGLRMAPGQDALLSGEVEKPASLLSLDATLSMGSNLRQFLFEWRTDLLVLLKLLLLQRRVMVFGYPTETLCGVQYDLISLVPGLLAHLDDCAQVQPPPEFVASDTLPLFSGNAVFHPYLPLQQIGLLQAQSWLVGTSNSVMLSQQDTQMDVLVNLESKTIELCGNPGPSSTGPSPISSLTPPSSFEEEHDILARKDAPRAPSSIRALPLAPDSITEHSQTSIGDGASQETKAECSDRPALSREELQAALQLTTADKRWMEEEIIPALLETWDERNPSRAATLSYRGSDDWLRAQFQGYIARLLASVARSETSDRAGMKGSATVPNTPLASRSPMHDAPVSLSRTSSTLGGKERDRSATVAVAHFGKAFVSALQSTLAYRLWRNGTDAHGATGHPFEARLSVFEGVSARLAASLDESRTSTLGKGLATASSAGLRWFASALGQGAPAPPGASGRAGETREESRPALSPRQETNEAGPTIPSPSPGSSLAPPDSQGSQASPSPLSAARAAWGSMGTYLSSWSGSPAPSRSAPPTIRAPRRQATAPLPQGETEALARALSSSHQRTTSTTCFPSHAPFSAPTAEEKRFVPPLARWRSQRGKENSHTPRRSRVGPPPGLSSLSSLE